MDGGDGWRQAAPVALLPLPRWTIEASVCMVARHYAPVIARRIETDPAELERLQTLAYCEATFGLAFPFLHRANRLPAALENRYLPNEILVQRHRYRITSQWLERHRSRLVAYLTGSAGLKGPAGLPLSVNPPSSPMPARTKVHNPFGR